MKKSLMKFILSIFVLLIYVLTKANLAFANSLTLPEPKGDYGVGIVNIELSDQSRTQLRSIEKRKWMATVFYPTFKTKSTSPYMPGTIEDGNVYRVKVLGHAIPNARAITGKKSPIIIAFPGRGDERQKETILYEALASNGYIVIKMDQPYVANFVKLSNGAKIVLTFQDARNLPRNRDYRYKYDDEVIDAAIKDIDFVLENFKAFGDLSSSFDTSKIILMGHSIGANIAHIKGFTDRRIKAVVDVDSKITERAVYGRIGVPPNPDAKPVLFIQGMMQYQEDVGDQLTKIPNSTIWSPYVQHSVFSDDAYFSAKIANYGMGFWSSLYNWLFKKGPDFSDIGTNLGDYNVDEWFKEYPECVVRWLDKIKST
ncbi:MAG: hypothetical protein ACK4OM_02875 [Alphaproteobacteria bacterium]